jgi:ubiquinone/menaquinone biosynthesis C-methylase UbiE
VLALDPDESMLARARASQPRELHSRVVFRAADITTEELPQAAFDVTVLSWSL